MEKIKTLLFAMTGFGNNALNTLLKHNLIELIGVFAPKRNELPFPYYKCEKLHDAVIKNGINLCEGKILKDKSSYRLIKRIRPDLIVVSTFPQRIPDSIIFLPHLGVINVHPSLLPKYRGATPTAWVLMNGENETGVTTHFIENENMDAGRIIAQAKMEIKPNDTDGLLRLKLANLSEAVLTDSLSLIRIKDKDMFPVQNEIEASYYPKRTNDDSLIDLGKTFKDIFNKIRAMSPYPGARLRYKGKEYTVKSALPSDIQSSNEGFIAERRELVLNILGGKARFFINGVIDKVNIAN